jgi:hypothetical protein
MACQIVFCLLVPLLRLLSPSKSLLLRQLALLKMLLLLSLKFLFHLFEISPHFCGGLLLPGLLTFKIACGLANLAATFFHWLVCVPVVILTNSISLGERFIRICNLLECLLRARVRVLVWMCRECKTFVAPSHFINGDIRTNLQLQESKQIGATKHMIQRCNPVCWRHKLRRVKTILQETLH